jgi:hypothetical protein
VLRRVDLSSFHHSPTIALWFKFNLAFDFFPSQRKTKTSYIDLVRFASFGEWHNSNLNIPAADMTAAVEISFSKLEAHRSSPDPIMTSDEHKLDESKHFSDRPPMLMNRTESFSMSENEINYLRVLHYYTPDDPPPVPLHEPAKPEYLQETFWDDCQNFRPGSVPHSTVVGTAIGIFCGLIAFVYYFILQQLLDLLWHQLPALIFAPYVDESLQWLWIPVLGLTMALGVGLTVKLLGEPGDLSYTVERVHGFGFIGMDHVLPMLFASQFSILGGGSLGPEAPLVAICASFSGYISRKLFRQTHMNVIRKHTLMVSLGCAR